jgi:hypothetical protein
MRGSVFLSGAFLVVSLLLSAPAAEAQERWAAVSSTDDGSGPVVWADSKEEASRRALAACRKVSDTCSDRAATTPDTSDILTVMCCNSPRHACGVGAESTREASQAQVQKMFDGEGFSNCRVIKHLSAETGARID